MASITLRTLWLTSTSDLSDSLSFPMLAKLTVTPAKPGETRRYANGRIRMVTRAGRAQSAAVTLPACDREQVQWLDEHTGQVLLVRSKDGRKFYGAYFDLTLDEHGYEDAADVALTLDEVTVDEAV